MGGQGLLPASRAACTMQPSTRSPVGRRGEHENPAHILAAESLGRDRQFQPVSFHKLDMQHRRGVVPRVYPAQRVFYHRAAQKPLGIPPRHTAVDCIPQQAAGDMRLLPQPGEHHCHAGILADRQAQLVCSVQILLQIPHDVPGQRHTFSAGRFLDRAADIPGRCRLASIHKSRTACSMAAAAISRMEILLIHSHFCDQTTRIPAANTADGLAAMVRGSPGNSTKSASLPGVMDPTRSSMPQIRAGPSVTASSAASYGSPSRTARPAHNARYCCGITGWSFMTASSTPPGTKAPGSRGQAAEFRLAPVAEQRPAKHPHPSAARISAARCPSVPCTMANRR